MFFNIGLHKRERRDVCVSKGLKGHGRKFYKLIYLFDIQFVLINQKCVRMLVKNYFSGFRLF